MNFIRRFVEGMAFFPSEPPEVRDLHNEIIRLISSGVQLDQRVNTFGHNVIELSKVDPGRSDSLKRRMSKALEKLRRDPTDMNILENIDDILGDLDKALEGSSSLSRSSQ